MFKMSWKVDGRRVDARNVGNALEKAVERRLSDAVQATVRKSVCPVHGQRATVTSKGPTSAVRFEVRGCCQQLIDDVTRKLR